MSTIAGREVLLNGRWPLWLPEHRAARPEWISPQGWERFRLDSMSRNILPGDIVYDIGAEEGDITALCAKWAGPAPLREFDATQERTAGGGVVAFEPNPAVWPNIRAIFEANGLTPLGCFVGFAGDEPRGENGLSEGWPACAYGEVIADHGFCQLYERPDIPAIILDSYVELTGLVPDVITMDVEGSEWRVCKGARRLLAEHKPMVYISIHADFMAELYSDVPELIYDLMRELGYRRELLGVDHETHCVFWHPDGRALR